MKKHKMNCILIFDNLNDVIYSKYNDKFCSHIKKLGISQGLISPNGKDASASEVLNPNLIIQLFSPVVTSQRIMALQFGNSYTSVQCQDGTNLVFDEYMGFLFMCIGIDPIIHLQHTLNVFISFVRHVCGPDVTELKRNTRSQLLLSRLMDTWQDLQSHDQACLVEAIEQLSVNVDITTTSINALKDACGSLKSSQSSFDCSRSHALLFVENKLLALYTSREAEDLSPSDTMFLSILSNSYSNKESTKQECKSVTEQSPTVNSKNPEDHKSDEKDSIDYDISLVKSEIVLLKGKRVFVPYAIHMSHFNSGVTLLLAYQLCNESLCMGFDETFSSLAKFNKLIGSESEVDVQKKVYESLENGMKKVLDSIKKIKNKSEIEPLSKQLLLKWEQIKKKYNECTKNNEDISVSLAANTANLTTCLRQFYQVMCLTTRNANLPVNHEAISKIAQETQTSLFHFTEFLKTKAHHNFTLRSRALLTINKYLEEFPGLVHFLYIDRNNHRVTAPFLHFSSEDTNLLTMKKIWEMVELSRSHIRDGHLAFMWKDTTFNYAYFLWFEDSSGTPMKPKINPMNVVKTLPLPGILAGDFYKSLIEVCFPKMTTKIRCFELYCIHLGLATSSCVLDHSRRIAASVWEVTGQHANNPNLF